MAMALALPLAGSSSLRSCGSRAAALPPACNRSPSSTFFSPLPRYHTLLPALALPPLHHHRKCNVTTTALFGKSKATPKTTRATVIPDPDYRIPIILLGTAGALLYQDNLLPAAPIGLLGLLLLVQTTRVRFVFDDEGLEVKVGKELDESGENVFVGGKNRWSYSSFVNWELWWPIFPVLVYFKETQTKPEGQIHFFPVIFNGNQLYDVMVERAGPSKTSGPKE
ncbi:uncharacterized protein [Physcomitrium patens]|uniref:DUF3119 family protein n=1 Tax=Physcomitrium patens TaxID=3218 RepID=A9SGC1_PHYPA|nr:uncharacterized protein LOC112284797 [Physcomitrium patens]PNR51106.1 hypothetical protein PHYPA_010292 [Physcomitrium patens]|eukprot:XP_024380813.1 uncharacterized protein LOC112284797 [Physcomitrella patens]